MTPGIQPTLVLVLFVLPTAILHNISGTAITTTAADRTSSNRSSNTPSGPPSITTERPESHSSSTSSGHPSITTEHPESHSSSTSSGHPSITTERPESHSSSTSSGPPSITTERPESHSSSTSSGPPSITTERPESHSSNTPSGHPSITTDSHSSSTTYRQYSPTSVVAPDHHTSPITPGHHSNTSAPPDHHTSTTTLVHYSNTSAPPNYHTSIIPTNHHVTIATKNTQIITATTGTQKSISSTLHQKVTPAPENNHSSTSQPITISQSTHYRPVVIDESSMFFLSFFITNRQFNSSLENPSSFYYQELKNSIKGLLQQIYKDKAFVTFYLLRFRKGSVITDCTVVFQEGSITSNQVQELFAENLKKSYLYNLTISPSHIIVREWNSEASSTDSAVPGYAIALLVIVCILLALAIFHFAALGVSHFRRKHCGQLDIFPSQDSYHPMNEYPPYHTHGRYVPPGNTKRSPYEEVNLYSVGTGKISPGNGGNSLSYVNPVATSANL